MSDEKLEEEFANRSTDLIKQHVERCAFIAQTLALTGIGTVVAGQFGRPPGSPETAPTTVVVVLSGPFPQDLVDSLFSHVRGTVQDFSSGNPAKIVDMRPNGPSK